MVDKDRGCVIRSLTIVICCALAAKLILVLNKPRSNMTIHGLGSIMLIPLASSTLSDSLE
jgi:hypothetical protein